MMFAIAYFSSRCMLAIRLLVYYPIKYQILLSDVERLEPSASTKSSKQEETGLHSKKATGSSKVFLFFLFSYRRKLGFSLSFFIFYLEYILLFILMNLPRFLLPIIFF